MKRILILFFLLQGICQAQTGQLTLDSCIRMTARNYPLIRQRALISENEKNTLSNDSKNWLPRLSFISKAAYQSEVISFQGITFPHDSYLAAVDMEQTVYDGGLNHQQKQLDKFTAESERNKNEVDLYQLIDRVNQLYSNILLSRENRNVLNIYKENIINKKKIVDASVKNGMLLQSNLDELEAEELKTEQSISEAADNLKAQYQSLTLYINQEVNDSTQFVTSAVMNTSQNELSRPEIKLYQTQRLLLDTRHKLNNRYALPHLSVSAEGAYGRPGPNFLNQDLRFFGQAAVNLRWNIGSLYTLNNEKQTIGINRKMVDVQQDVFEFNIKNKLLTQAAEIESLNDMLAKDRIIIEKRKSVTRSASVQLENGVITTADYLSELNAEMQAILNQKIHEVRLMNAISNYNTTKGIKEYSLN
jgi:outer membrane protein TolC